MTPDGNDELIINQTAFRTSEQVTIFVRQLLKARDIVWEPGAASNKEKIK